MAYEDFKNDYAEQDVGGYINADTSNDRVDFVNIPAECTAHFSKDFGAGHFTNFTHLIDFYLDAVAESGVSRCSSSIGTTVAPLDDQADAFQVVIHGSTTTKRIYLYDKSSANSDRYDISLDTSYYLKCIRSGTAFSVEIYDASAREVGDLLDTISVVGSETAFRYCLAGQSANWGETGDITGYMEHLDLQEAPPAGNPWNYYAQIA